MWNWLLKLLQHPASRPNAEPVPDAPDVLFSRPATWEDVIATARLLNQYLEAGTPRRCSWTKCLCLFSASRAY
jgi:hypothetical protein